MNVSLIFGHTPQGQMSDVQKFTQLSKHSEQVDYRHYHPLKSCTRVPRRYLMMSYGTSQHVRATVASSAHIPLSRRCRHTVRISSAQMTAIHTSPHQRQYRISICLVIKGRFPTLQCMRGPPYMEHNSSSTATPERCNPSGHMAGSWMIRSSKPGRCNR